MIEKEILDDITMIEMEIAGGTTEMEILDATMKKRENLDATIETGILGVTVKGMGIPDD